MGEDFKLPPFTVEAQMVSLSETMDWGLRLYGIPELWKRTKGAGVITAVLDTGIDKRHLEIGDLKQSVLAARDFTGSSVGYFDLNGHGTHTAGTIAARQNDVGVVGVAPDCQLLVGKVLGDDGSGGSAGVTDGIKWAANSGANIISMSLGSPQAVESIHQALIEAVSGGCCVICAAGNEGPAPGIDTVGYPARWPESVAVGAVDDKGRVAQFTSRGPEVDICAPGVNVLSTFLNGGYAKLSGTSMATPFVSGVVTLLLSTGLRPTPATLKSLLRSTARAFRPGEGMDAGVGLIDPAALLTPTPVTPGAVQIGPFRVSVETIGDKQGLFISIA